MHTLDTDEATVTLPSITVGRHFRISQVHVRPGDARQLLWLGVFEGSRWCLLERDTAGNVILQEAGGATVSLRAKWAHGMRVQCLSQPVLESGNGYDGDFARLSPPNLVPR